MCADADEAPFYLSVHYTAPHSPWTGHPQDIVDSYDDCPFVSCPQEEMHPWANWVSAKCLGNREMLKGYFAAVTAMDLDVGRILDRLERHAIGERTLVVFTSDNGFNCGHLGFWGKGNGTWPLNMYENSIKVPFLASHPGRVPQGRTTDQMCSAVDFMPTLLAYAGVDLPERLRRGRPGRSFAGLLEGGAAPARDRVVIYDEYGATRMIRTAEWKYVHRYPAAGGPGGPNELYDLVNDPDERTNQVDDPGQQRRIRDLSGMLEEWFAQHVTADKDGRNLPVSGGGQLRPVGRGWDNASPAFTPDNRQPSPWWRDK